MGQYRGELPFWRLGYAFCDHVKRTEKKDLAVGMNNILKFGSCLIRLWKFEYGVEIVIDFRR